jgi:hypothetical protein
MRQHDGTRPGHADRCAGCQHPTQRGMQALYMACTSCTVSTSHAAWDINGAAETFWAVRGQSRERTSDDRVRETPG